MFKVGDKVVMVDKERHAMNPKTYPPYGTMGVIMDINETDEKYVYDIQWEKGTTSGDDCWFISEDGVVQFVEYTDDEVWKMLKPKMRQLVPAYIENLDMYSPIVKKMVVAAYRSGYGRAMKGRPFMIKPKNIVKN